MRVAETAVEGFSDQFLRTNAVSHFWTSFGAMRLPKELLDR